MKRSKMIEIIKDYIRDTDFSYCADEEELDDETGYLLGLIEKAGMLPPSIPGSGHGIDCVWYPDYGWEPENEKK